MAVREGGDDPDSAPRPGRAGRAADPWAGQTAGQTPVMPPGGGPGRDLIGGLAAGEVIALALSAVWLLAATVFFFAVGFRDGTGAAGSGGEGSDPLRGVIVALAVFLPIALIWVATLSVASARAMRAEGARLGAQIDAMRQAYMAQAQAARTAVRPSVDAKLDAILMEQRRASAAPRHSPAPAAAPVPAPSPAPIRPRRPEDREDDASGPASDRAEQGALALAGPRPSEPVTMADFIVAMNFPESPDDTEGFRALRRAMRDRHAASLIQASQDLLTLLSQEGIYMDDLAPDRARPELWRKFARGERGRPVAQLGGIHDEAILALTAARMRQDAVFRDTAHHFLRKFDTVFAEFGDSASDAEITALSDTRTARAFMLVGRVAGAFD